MSSHKYQSPKGTRDFYPPDMAVRRYVESVWRDVSIRHGFEEVDGPTFEHLDLYTVKSGPGIVSELFSFRRAGGETDYALRPEFTPTLARMVASKAARLAKPIKWFSMPSMFRAERPQRGRLREHFQWNVDIIGEASPRAEAELIAVAADALRRWGLTPDDMQIRMSHRGLVAELLSAEGVATERAPEAFALLDKRDKMPAEQFAESAAALGLSPRGVELFQRRSEPMPLASVADGSSLPLHPEASVLEDFRALLAEIDALDLVPWCAFDLGIVRGLAYYTGVVFELHETTGRERAVAGGGRYDNLVELFGGPPTPAV
ncbi:MAG: histidine--tRNA ligase, partial [Planctomycetota bacterium]